MPARKTTQGPFSLYMRFRSKGLSPKEAKQKTRLFLQVYNKKRLAGLSPADSREQTLRAFKRLAIVQNVKQHERVGSQAAKKFLEETISPLGLMTDLLQAKLKSRGFRGKLLFTEAGIIDQVLKNELGENRVLAQRWSESPHNILEKVLDAYADARMRPFKKNSGKPLPQKTAEPKTVIVHLLHALHNTFPDYRPKPPFKKWLEENLKSTNAFFRAEEYVGFLRRLKRELSASGIRRIPIEQQRHAITLWLEMELDSFSQKQFRDRTLRELQTRFADFNRSPNAVQQRRIEESPTVAKIVRQLVKRNQKDFELTQLMRKLLGNAPDINPGDHAFELLSKMLAIRNNRDFLRKQLVRKILPEFFKKTG